MADLQRTIEILFNGVDEVSDTLATIGGGLTKFGDTASNIGEPFADITKGVLALDAAIAGLAVAALLANSKIEQESTKMANALGLPTAEAEKFKEVAENVYNAGIGENLEDAFSKATTAASAFKNASTEDLQSIITKSEKLSSTFGTEYSENLSAVQTLMKNFGISSDEAFDLIASGFQKGLNDSGDFIDSINEYSTQFANGGADAGQFFSVLETGFQQGSLGTDRAADMFKEFRVRIQDDSKTTKESLQSIGIDPVKFAADLDSGKMSAVEAFQKIQDALVKVDDKGIQMRAGVGLMGTQFEDMGTKAALAVNTTNTKLEDLKGTMDKFNPDESLGKKFEQAFRSISTTIADAKIWDSLGDDLGVTLDDIKNSFTEAFKDIDFGDIENAFDDLVKTIGSAFGDIDLDLTSVEGMKNAIELAKDAITGLINTTKGISEVFLPLISFAKDAVKWFSELSPETQSLVGNILGLGTALTGVGVVVGAGGSLVSGLGSLVGFLGVGSKLGTGISLIVGLLSGPAGLAIALGSVGAAIAGYTMSSMNSENKAAQDNLLATSKKIDEFYTKVKAIGDSDTRIKIMAAIETRDFDTAQKLIDDWTAKDKETKIKTEVDNKAFDSYWDKLDKLPKEKQTQILVAINAGDIAAVEAFLDDIPDEKQVDILAKYNKASGDSVKKEFEQVGKRADGSPIMMEVTAKTKDLDKVKKDIESIPTEKMLEIKLQGEIDTRIEQIKSSAETAQAAFEWTAQVNIASIEADSNQAIAFIDNIGQSVSSLADSTANMFGSLVSGWDDLDMGAQWDFMDILETQQETQNKALESQIRLNDAQAKYMEAKSQRLQSGNSLISIDSSGLEPALEMVMWQILEKVQLRVNEEAADLLLGMGGL